MSFGVLIFYPTKILFFLKEGVLWSDGRPLRAQDFVDSWIRLLDPKTKSIYASYLFDIVNAEEYNSGGSVSAPEVGVRALDEKRLQIKLKRPVPENVMLTPCCFPEYPLH